MIYTRHFRTSSAADLESKMQRMLVDGWEVIGYAVIQPGLMTRAPDHHVIFKKVTT